MALPPKQVAFQVPATTQDQGMEQGLVAAIRSSLNAKLERLLQRPLVARVLGGSAKSSPAEFIELPPIFSVLDQDISNARPANALAGSDNAWLADSDDGTCTIPIQIDYDDCWRSREREVLEMVMNTVESHVTYLTEEQRQLLERSPREFLAINPPPDSAELVAFRKETIGGAERVIELVVAAPPVSPAHTRYIAIVPNLIPLERQLAAIHTIESSAPDGELAPLRVLIGLPGTLPVVAAASQTQATQTGRLDTHQQECVAKSLATPHYAVIQGPPGSGKTTVIATVIRQTLDRGGRILVVSPTHVAVDNVVEKLVQIDETDDLSRWTIPIRYAAKRKKLLPAAVGYWVGPRQQRRAQTLAKRLEHRLRAIHPLAERLFARMDQGQDGQAPLTQAIASVHGVICGTPIGILSFDPVKQASPGTYDLLIVDEVSKTTLPEFLAVAVKAKRWVLVGDPAQLPPFNNAEENGVTLDEVLDPLLELVCSVGAILEREKPYNRHNLRLIVVTTDPQLVAAAISEHIRDAAIESAPGVSVFRSGTRTGILVCSPQEITEATCQAAPTHGRDRTCNPDHAGSLDILVERGLQVQRPEFASGLRLVEPRLRAQSLIFENVFNVYHAQPWQKGAHHKLPIVKFRNGFDKYLPSAGALSALAHTDLPKCRQPDRAAILSQIAEQYAINAISVYDWLTGIPIADFDASPLINLARVQGSCAGLQDAVRPFVGTLRKQYRMHPSISQVPRDLFYFGKALQDGLPKATPGCLVRLIQVVSQEQVRESNRAEIQTICTLLGKLNTAQSESGKPLEHILVISPYREQEKALKSAVETPARPNGINGFEVEICTLDRCQGREADYVFISLVRNRPTPFLDAPKRWNVALTRAKKGLFIVGDIDAYLREAIEARQRIDSRRGDTRPSMSLLARILEAYDRQMAGGKLPGGIHNGP